MLSRLSNIHHNTCKIVRSSNNTRLKLYYGIRRSFASGNSPVVSFLSLCICDSQEKGEVLLGWGEGVCVLRAVGVWWMCAGDMRSPGIRLSAPWQKQGWLLTCLICFGEFGIITIPICPFDLLTLVQCDESDGPMKRRKLFYLVLISHSLLFCVANECALTLERKWAKGHDFWSWRIELLFSLVCLAL